jgi:hypothetical protein
MPRTGELTVALSLVMAAIAAGYALYSYLGPVDAARLASAPVAQSSVAQQEWSTVDTEPLGDPLRVANPFDSSEVFEFPAGTSESDAHEAIAGFLIDRASRRGAAGQRPRVGPKG